MWRNTTLFGKRVVNKHENNNQTLSNDWLTYCHTGIYVHADWSNSSKGLCYKKFKDCFEFENFLNLLDDKDRQLLCKFRTCNHWLPIEIGRWQGIERQNRTCNIRDKNEIGDEFHYVLQCPSLHNDRRRLFDSTYLTRVNIWKFANLFQSRNKIKLRHHCKFIKIILSKTRPPV